MHQKTCIECGIVNISGLYLELRRKCMFKILLSIAGILGFGIGLFGEAMKKL